MTARLATQLLVSGIALFLAAPIQAQSPQANAPELEARAEAAALRGELGEAARLWQRAEAARAEAGSAAGRFRALLRRGELERDLGRSRESLASLMRAVELAQALGPAEQAAARGALGSALVSAGDVDAGIDELAAGAALAPAAEHPELAAAIANEQARALAARGDVTGAIAAYARAAQAEDSALAFRALVNRAALLAVEGEAEAVRTASAQARARGLALPPSHQNAQAWTRLGRAGAALAQRSGEPDDASAAAGDLARASAQAEALDDAAVASWAQGSRAELLAATGDLSGARAAAREALRAARGARLPDAELAWLALSGRLARQAGDRTRALALLAEASDSLAVRRASSGGTLQGALGTPTVGAEIHMELVDVLLEGARDHADPQRGQADLRLAQSTLERFKAGELRDYFRDGCVDAYREKVRDPASASPTAAIVYPIALADRLELLVSSQAGIRQFTVPVERDTLDADVARLARELRNRGSFDFRPTAERVYDWLVRPVLPHLEQLGVDTLVFVPGGALRTIPMAALYDGDAFLIERFAVATTPGLELTDPRPIDGTALNGFLGGLSEAVQGFPALENVPEELAAISERVDGTLLIDADFTTRDVRSTLGASEFSIVHIATHGKFGANPEDTFLLTYDGRLTMDELAEAVGAFRFREQPLELILLSACETAAGDERAALGLAGVAVKAGARSAIGSLWAVSDNATAILVEAFYRELAQPGASRASALRKAQLAVLADLRFRHPGYWAPFLLINNWL